MNDESGKIYNKTKIPKQILLFSPMTKSENEFSLEIEKIKNLVIVMKH